MIVSTHEKFLGFPFELKAKDVKDLTSSQLIELAQIQCFDNIGTEVKVSEHNLKSKSGKYEVHFSLMKGEEVLDHLSIEVKVKGIRWVLWIASALLLLALLGGYLWLNSRPPTTLVAGLPASATEKMTDQQLKEYAAKKVDSSNVTLQVYHKVSVEEDGKTAKLFVQNVPTNETGQLVTLKDKESGEVLYRSDLLKPGYQTSDILLDKKLSKGEHEGLVTLTFYDLKEEKQVGQTDVEVTLTVK